MSRRECFQEQLGFIPHSLSSQHLGVEIAHKLVAVAVADGQEGIVIENYAVLVDLLYLLQIDDVRTMYAHKLDGWQTLLYALHAEQHDDGTLALNVDFKIFAHALHITYVVHVNLHHLVLCLEEDGVVKEVLHRYPTLKLKLSFQFQRGMVKLIHAEGLEQIVDGIEPKAVNGMLRVGCGEDHEWRGCQGTHKIESAR